MAVHISSVWPSLGRPGARSLMVLIVLILKYQMLITGAYFPILPGLHNQVDINQTVPLPADYRYRNISPGSSDLNEVGRCLFMR